MKHVHVAALRITHGLYKTAITLLRQHHKIKKGKCLIECKISRCPECRMSHQQQGNDKFYFKENT